MQSLLRCNPIARRAICVAAAKPAGKEVVSVPKKAPAKKAPVAKELKRAPSAFNLFVKDVFPVVKKENPALDFAAASQRVREKWQSATAETKAPYEKEAAKLKAVVDAKRAEEKAKARPPGAYILFVKKARPAVVAAHPGKTAMEVGKLLGEQWKALAPAEQQKYKDEAKALLDAWKSTKSAAV